MTEPQDIYRRARSRGLSDAEARAYVQLYAPSYRAQAEQAQAMQREAAAPPPAFTWDRADHIDALASAQLDRNLDPQRGAIKAAKRAEIAARMRPLVTQRDALNQQIAALEAEYHAAL